MANTFAGNALPSDKIAVAPRFCIEVDGTIVATFSECSGLSATVRTDKWEQGGENHTTLKFPGRTDFGNVTLKHGLAEDTALFDWFIDILNGKNKRKDMTVKLVNADLEELQSWHFMRAFPVKWTGPTLQTNSNAIAIETIELAHDGFIII